MLRRQPPLLWLFPLALTVGVAWTVQKPKTTVGLNRDGSYTVATEQRIRPAGNAVVFGGRPVDLVPAPGLQNRIYIKDNRGIVVVDRDTKKVLQELSFPKEGGGSLHGILVSRDGKRLWASGAGNTVWEVSISAEGKLDIARGLVLPGPDGKGASYPCGLAASPDERTLYVCLSRNNSVALVNLADGKVTREIPVGVAPFDIVLTGDGQQAWVSNWGGRRPRTGENTTPSAGTPTLSDERGVASSGTVSLVSPGESREVAQVATGLHPSDLALSPDGKRLYVANANDDTVSIIDTGARVARQTLVVKPDLRLPFGSMPNALCLTADGRRLFVACAGNNAVASVEIFAEPKELKQGEGKVEAALQGWIPAGWYPGAVAVDNGRLFIANVKGNGSRRSPEKQDKEKPENKGWNVYHYAGTVSSLAVPDVEDTRKWTQQVLADARVPEALRAGERARSGRAPMAIPERGGEPSVIEHVVYIIKENRTYDQIFGDLKQGDGDPSLCIFGRDITPNHHALAEQFVLLDNFYCNGVLSADGHSWVTEGNVTDHLEKAFGGFTRSYTFGDDPLTYSTSGFLWDNALARGLSFTNYGEMDYTSEKPDSSFRQIYQDWKEKAGKITFTHSIGVPKLKRYSVPDAPGWNMDIPDVVRADIFLRDLKRYETEGKLPNLIIIYLPNDHTTGTTPGDPTPRAYLADNDLALGQVVEGVSKSKFWPTTAIFVVEDDPQAGFDHVDGHRSLCLVVSPYTRRGAVISDFYNQTSVIHTIERILGLPPMNQRDASSPVMASCFTNTPNLAPYTALENRVPLTETNPARAALPSGLQKWADASLRQDFKGFDRADEDTLNRILWHAMRGADVPYPTRLAGSHGSGLRHRGLTLSADDEGEEEDEKGDKEDHKDVD